MWGGHSAAKIGRPTSARWKGTFVAGIVTVFTYAKDRPDRPTRDCFRIAGPFVQKQSARYESTSPGVTGRQRCAPGSDSGWRASFYLLRQRFEVDSAGFQQYRASGLNLVVAAITLWNTVYLERAVTLLGEIPVVGQFCVGSPWRAANLGRSRLFRRPEPAGKPPPEGPRGRIARPPIAN